MISVLCAEGAHEHANRQWPKEPLCKGDQIITKELVEVESVDRMFEERKVPPAEQVHCQCPCHGRKT